jgi:formate-dependent nitrite reductase membrane component NrfD
MTWGVYILSVFIIIGAVKGFCVFKKKTVPNVLSWAGAFLALATGAYTGLLLAVVKAIPFWNSGIMPVLFVVSALSTGLSVTSLLAAWIEKGESGGEREGKAHIILIATEIIIAAIFFWMMASGTNGPVGAKSAMMVMFESYNVVFWGYFIGLGLLFPLLVYTLQYLESKQFVQQAVCEPSDSMKETAAAAQNGHQSTPLTIVTDISVLVGGFALRVLIVFAALPIWDGVTII